MRISPCLQRTDYRQASLGMTEHAFPPLMAEDNQASPRSSSSLQSHHHGQTHHRLRVQKPLRKRVRMPFCYFEVYRTDASSGSTSFGSGLNMSNDAESGGIREAESPK